jgi:hypothetical protein
MLCLLKIDLQLSIKNERDLEEKLNANENIIKTLRSQQIAYEEKLQVNESLVNTLRSEHKTYESTIASLRSERANSGTNDCSWVFSVKLYKNLLALYRTTVTKLIQPIFHLTKRKFSEKGSFGKVYQGSYYRLPVAVKKIKNSSPRAIDEFKHEVQLLMYS